jgi:hypothetical protein
MFITPFDVSASWADSLKPAFGLVCFINLKMEEMCSSHLPTFQQAEPVEVAAYFCWFTVKMEAICYSETSALSEIQRVTTQKTVLFKSKQNISFMTNYSYPCLHFV